MTFEARRAGIGLQAKLTFMIFQPNRTLQQFGGASRLSARVLRYAIVDETVSANGENRSSRGVMGPAAALAICEYDGEQGYYVLYCDAEWRVVTDTRHESIERALRQAEFEYNEISID